MNVQHYRLAPPRVLVSSVLLLSLLTGCGGSGPEPEVPVYTSLPHGADYFVVPGSARQIQADLRQRGIVFSNPQCADWQRHPDPALRGGWVEGIPPVYLVLQMPESSWVKLDALYPNHFYRDPDKNPEIVQPYFDCASRGY